jgi:hypothetical protein
VYCANLRDYDVAIIDGASNCILGKVKVGWTPVALCYNGQTNKVYCANYGGSSISVLRGVVGIQETMNDERGTMNVGPTILRGILNLQSAIFNLQSETALLDISGRKVLNLHPGGNDVRSLAPGVYFVRAVSRELLGVSCNKVVVTK